MVAETNIIGKVDERMSKIEMRLNTETQECLE